jgi:DNA-binding LacI/PurR family transcriptional regulator
MPSYSIVSALVSKVLANSPELPADYRDADAATRRKVENMAEAQGSTPARIWEVIRAQHSEDIRNAQGQGFDAEAIAKAARR